MRARMSDPSARGPLGCRYLGMLAPREAVDEARSILAETEPNPVRGERYNIAAINLGACGKINAASILAESLRSFVEGC